MTSQNRVLRGVELITTRSGEGLRLCCSLGVWLELGGRVKKRDHSISSGASSSSIRLMIAMHRVIEEEKLLSICALFAYRCLIYVPDMLLVLKYEK